MKKISEADKLNDAISILSRKRDMELLLLREQFFITYESLKPINVIKDALKDVAASPEIKGNIWNNVIGLTAGYLSKKVLMGNSRNPIKRLTGVFLQFAISNFVSRHSDSIKVVGENVFKKIFKNKSEDEKEFADYKN